jgi:hypothetical protein
MPIMPKESAEWVYASGSYNQHLGHQCRIEVSKLAGRGWADPPRRRWPLAGGVQPQAKNAKRIMAGYAA